MQAALVDCFSQFLAFLGRDELRIDEDALAQADLGWLRAAF
jgi:hypothetical protein